jgi:hypothetical protein
MTDEHLMRQWTATHDELSGDLDRGLLRLGRCLSNRLHANSRAYAPACPAAAPAETSLTARAALAGALACLATTVLLVTVGLLTTAGTHGGAALALVSPAIVA